MKLRKTFNGNVKAVSPVIATIIIVAIAIVMSIAVAYWMLGLGGAFTRYEKLEIQSAYATKESGNFVITARVKNTGSADATLDIIFLNGIPQMDAVGLNSIVVTGDAEVTLTGNSTGNMTSSMSATLTPGQQATMKVTLSGTNYNSGMSLELKLQTVAGNQYPKVIVLP